jgi:ribosome biogenesis GTPase
MTDDPMAAAGLVVAAHGQRGILETPEGDDLRYLVKGKRLRAVCGDRVEWTLDTRENTAIVTNIFNRNNALERSSPGRKAPDILAANLSCLAVVFASVPKPDWFLIDRYLCVGTLMGCRVVLVGNKNDLADAANVDTAEIRDYLACGYEFVSVSAKNSDTLGPLGDTLKGEIGILVGQSGVGKSSLINRLVPDAGIRVGAISRASAEGTHTTTESVMHSLPGGGRLIDSPGVRDFFPAIVDERTVQVGYPEILAAAADCRFSDCRHLREPDCAVKSGIDTGNISPRRYESYKRLLRSIAD